MALCSDLDNKNTTRFIDFDGGFHRIDGELWDLGNLVKEVFI